MGWKLYPAKKALCFAFEPCNEISKPKKTGHKAWAHRRITNGSNRLRAAIIPFAYEV
jgi:hypothetical protein